MYQHPSYFPMQPINPNTFHQPYIQPHYQYSNGFQPHGGYNQIQMYPQYGSEQNSGYLQQPQLFQNPLQPVNHHQNQHEMYNGNTPYTNNPYPKANLNVKSQSGGMNSIMNSFKSQDGSIDFNKMVNTAGQMMNAVNQVSSMVKGLGGIFKV
jgi:hypothetical protein